MTEDGKWQRGSHRQRLQPGSYFDGGSIWFSAE